MTAAEGPNSDDITPLSRNNQARLTKLSDVFSSGPSLQLASGSTANTPHDGIEMRLGNGCRIVSENILRREGKIY